MLVPKHVWSLAKIAAKSSTRYAISGINFQAKGGHAHAAATDGRRLAVLSWELASNESFASVIVPRHACIAACAMKRDIELTCAKNGQLLLTAIAAPKDEGLVRQITVAAAAGKFPDYSAMIPQYGEDTANTIGVDAMSLTDLLASAATLQPNVTKLVVPHDPKRAVVIRASSDDECRGSITAVLMPRNLDA